MNSSLLYNLFDAAEFWALLFPLLLIFPIRKSETWKKPLAVFIFLALPINFINCLIANSNFIPFDLPFQNNTVLYNVMSIIRFSCFTWFFYLIPQKGFSTFAKLIPIAYLVCFIILFAFFENFFNTEMISSNLLAAEAFLLLMFCLLSYFSIYRAEDSTSQSDSLLWIISGLALYVVIDFFLYLFYEPLILEDPILADKSWTIHNIAFTIFCGAMARGLYLSKANTRKEPARKV